MRSSPSRPMLAEHAGLARVRAAPFEALELELAALWV
jgi:hypothetical protein